MPIFPGLSDTIGADYAPGFRVMPRRCGVSRRVARAGREEPASHVARGYAPVKRRRSGLDRLIYRFQDRWETDRQFRAMVSGVLGLVMIIALCSCMGVVTTIANNTVASVNAARNVGVANSQNADTGIGQIKGVPTFPTATVAFLAAGQLSLGWRHPRFTDASPLAHIPADGHRAANRDTMPDKLRRWWRRRWRHMGSYRDRLWHTVPLHCGKRLQLYRPYQHFRRQYAGRRAGDCHHIPRWWHIPG